MMTLLITAAALAEASNSPLFLSDTDAAIVVEGRRSAGNWEMPKLEYHEPASCPVLVETEIRGFGVMRIKKRCASDQTEEWRLLQH